MVSLIENDENDPMASVREKLLLRNKPLALSLIIFYILLVKWILPEFMKNRKPFDLRRVIIAYNFFQTVANAIIAYNLIKYTKMSWENRCSSKHHPARHELVKNVSIHFWHLYLIKYADFLDTIFFILRKKENQATFLHVFHHAMMVLMMILVFHWKNYGYYILLGIDINTSIHVIMYFYYALAAMGPHMRKYLWWKKYLTLLQMTQFVVVLVYMIAGFFTGCEEISGGDMICFSFVLIILILFMNYYSKSYTEKKNLMQDSTAKAFQLKTN